MLTVSGLTKRYGSGKESVLAVDDVSFSVEEGSIVGVLGPNGAGKTTLIKSALGLIIPTTGTVTVAGDDVFETPKAAREHVDAVLEGARNTYWRLTVRENLEFFTRLSGGDPKAYRERHDRLLDRLKLAERADDPVRDLSRGMKQKVSLASALAEEPELLFLDEPTLGLDVESSLELRAELARLVEEEEMTVVLSSHDMDVIEELCDRVVILNEGRVLRDGTTDELMDELRSEVVRLTFSPDEALLGRLQERYEVTAVERREARGEVAIEVNLQSWQELGALLGLFEEAGVELAGVETLDPDFEHAFLEITGTGPGAKDAESMGSMESAESSESVESTEDADV